MPPKPKLRNWNDVQIMLATISIAATLGLWNLFAEPVKTVTAQVQDEPVTPPPTEEPPTPAPVAVISTAMPQTQPQIQPQTKIMFTQVAPQTSNVVQPQKKKKKNNNNNGGGGSGGGGTVTNTKSS